MSAFRGGEWLLYGLLVCLPLQAQNDSTGASEAAEEDSVRYGTHTTYTFSTTDLLTSAGNIRTLDTLFDQLGLITVPERHQFSYTNLGALGTAARPLFYQLPSNIGHRSGLTAFEAHYMDPSEMPLYNCRSPFLSAEAFLGEGERSRFGATFGYNLNPRTNLSIAIQSSTVDKQIGSRRRRGDRQSAFTAIQMQGNTFSKDSTYASYVAFSQLNHTAFDQGGSVFDVEEKTSVRFFYRRATPGLKYAHGRTLNRSVETLQRLRVLPKTYLYVKGAWDTERFVFHDDLNTDDSVFYENHFISKDSTHEEMDFTAQRLQAGIFCDTSIYYRLYVEKRWVQYDENAIKQAVRETETSLGAVFRHSIPFLGTICLDGKFLTEAHYRLKLGLEWPFLGASVANWRYKPALFQQYYTGNHHNWEQILEDTEAFSAALQTHNLRWGDLSFGAEIRAYQLLNYVYYTQDQVPIQLPKDEKISIREVNMNLRYAFLYQHMVLEGNLVNRNFLSQPSPAFAFPTWQTQGALYYQGSWFQDNLRIQIGLRYRWHSGYKGFAYQPVLQQFHAQDVFELQQYIPLDVFMRGELYDFNFYLQYIHANKQSGNGYFPTPYYQGEQTFFDVGFKWHLFD